MAKTSPILDLDTLIKRPIIKIDGVNYEIISPDELSVLDHHRLMEQGKRLDALLSASEMGEEDEAEIKKLLVKITDWIMVGVPPEVRAKLTDAQRMDVGQVFTALPLRKYLISMMQEAGATQIGGKPSPIFKDSMGEVPLDGLQKSLSRLLGRT